MPEDTNTDATTRPLPTKEWDAPSLFLAATVVTLTSTFVGYFLLTSSSDGAWASSAEHWWGLATLAGGILIASAIALPGLIAKGVEIGLKAANEQSSTAPDRRGPAKATPGPE